MHDIFVSLGNTYQFYHAAHSAGMWLWQMTSQQSMEWLEMWLRDKGHIE